MKNCKECPHIIRNKHNDMVVNFSIKHNKKHNCHMINGGKNLWKVDKKTECYGSKLLLNENDENNITSNNTDII